jgi:hypothetical protein
MSRHYRLLANELACRREVSIENREVLPQRARIMHHQSQLADLVDVLAVDFDIIDRLGDSRKGYAQNDRKAIETLQGFTLG